jgi:hypothetical protein
VGTAHGADAGPARDDGGRHRAAVPARHCVRRIQLASGLALLVASALAGLLWDRLGGASTFIAGAAISLLALAVLAWKAPANTGGS